MEWMFVGPAAATAGRRLGRDVSPRELTALLYDRVVPGDLAPVVGGRRLVSAAAIDAIVEALRARDRDGHREQEGVPGES